jgi:Na+/citrate or Na+/malate symporter
MRITPATGIFSGKIPGMRNGKSVTVSHQGMLFPVDMPIGAGGSARGAGFIPASVGSSSIRFDTE